MVESISTLEELYNRESQENDVVYIEETESYKVYKNGEWVDWDSSDSNLTLSLYDLNKSMFANTKNMDWRKVENVIKKWNPSGTYFLLYGKEISYFTLFKRSDNTTEKFHEVFKDCLINVGDLKACDITEDEDALEVWIKQKENGEMTCLYLFNYDEGVVKFNG